MRKPQVIGSGKRLFGLAGVVFAATFLAALFVLAPGAPGRAELRTFVDSRTIDQHFAGCDEAHATGRENIPWFDPSYRPEMDGDGDGLACEPLRGRRSH